MMGAHVGMGVQRLSGVLWVVGVCVGCIGWSVIALAGVGVMSGNGRGASVIKSCTPHADERMMSATTATGPNALRLWHRDDVFMSIPPLLQINGTLMVLMIKVRLRSKLLQWAQVLCGIPSRFEGQYWERGDAP